MAFAFSVVGSKGTPILVALALVLLMLLSLPFYVHFHLVCRELSVLCSFSSYLLCNWLSFSRISVPLMLLYFSSPNHRLSAFARNSKLTLLRHRHCCTFVVVPRLSASTQLAIRSWGFCRCFADKVGFAAAAPTFELCVPQLGILLLCVLCLAICLCASPNLVGMLSLTGSLLFGLLLVSPSAISFLVLSSP